ncbi:DNA-3-methyladenine glycosylase [Lysinibacillus contaminans]|uniref:DNA-3-methyladenine glycosylase II n=1 Tax=Lysinibacillus contaminans TaxID=1293441 RepID=A0ABR5K2U4_9BACI|nr:DNA-3-methyladenine glycosylase [Lysinibacillus contaminans]KOS69046.1 DNA-3-methyladenine glycosylase [Lysinibacillus contaminans]
MNWINHQSYLEIYPPAEFNFEECLVFLSRSDQELLHQIRDGYLYKLIKIEQELVLCKIGCRQNVMQVEFPINPPVQRIREEIVAYIWEWFDLDSDLTAFYVAAKQDKILQGVVYKYHGLRMMCIPDLFEALTWAVIGQQINLTFAYTLKKRFIENFGECLIFEGNTYCLFPTFEMIGSIEVEDLRKLQFTARKSEYIIELAKRMGNGQLTKETLIQKKDYPKVKKALMEHRGIGAWTADYVMMKCLHHPNAFPITDVGLHNALKLQLGLERKPTLEEIKNLAENWVGWEAYSTFYLWRSLYD